MSGNLDHRPSKIVKKYLLDRTLGTEVTADDEWPIFTDHFNEGSDDDNIDDNMLCVYNTGGAIQGHVQVIRQYQEQHGIMIMVRATSETTGWAKAKAIQEDLDKQVLRTGVVIGGSNYMLHAMHRTGDINRLGTESETRKRKFTINYLASITQVS